MRTEVKYVELTKRLMETSNKKIKLKDKGIKFQKKKLVNFSERDIRLLDILKTIYTYKDQMQPAWMEKTVKLIKKFLK